jgi:hypothetical protein
MVKHIETPPRQTSASVTDLKAQDSPKTSSFHPEKKAVGYNDVNIDIPMSSYLKYLKRHETSKPAGTPVA